MSETSGIFKAKYGAALQGRADWINAIEPEDRKLLIEIGMRAWDYGRAGGRARAEKAVRDSKGHFARPDGTTRLDEQEPVSQDWDAEVVSQFEPELQLFGFSVVAHGRA